MGKSRVRILTRSSYYTELLWERRGDCTAALLTVPLGYTSRQSNFAWR